MNDAKQPQKGNKLFEGKTKIGYEVVGKPNLVIMQAKDDITAFDNPDLTRKFGSKARCATSTTCRMFELLAAAGIPVAFVHQLSETEFLAPKVKMILLEVVARRLAVGSFIKRHPEMQHPDNEPYRFARLFTEFFLKTSGGKLVIDGKTLVEGLDPQKGQEDPLIADPYAEEWRLLHSKKPLGHPECDLERTVLRDKVVEFLNVIRPMDKILRKVFLVLEGAWNTLGLRLVDLKIEFGITVEGKLVVADVIDNDSWRLRDQDWAELSKQRFRDGDKLSAVEEVYQLVAHLAERIRIPRQAIVLWRGSDKDSFPEIPALPEIIDDIFKRIIIPSQTRDVNQGGCQKMVYLPTEINCLKVTLSAHKQPTACLSQLEKLQRDFPDGGVILATAGRSNGLGPMLSAHTTWPVISVPPGIKEFSEDVWSSLRMPSGVPNATILECSNAVLFAFNILSAKNPVAYMIQRFAIEARMEN